MEKSMFKRGLFIALMVLIACFGIMWASASWGYTGTTIKDLDVTRPDGATEAPSVLDNSDREIKTVLKNQYAVTAVTGNTTLTAAHSIVTVDTSGGAVTITLPAVATVSSSAFTKEYFIFKTDSTTNTVTVDASGSETINGSLTKSLSVQYESIQLIGNGTSWMIGAPFVADSSITTAKIAVSNITQALINSSSVGQAELKTSTARISLGPATSINNQNITMADYSFFPSIYTDYTGGDTILRLQSSSDADSTGRFVIYIPNGGTAKSYSIRYRYITASEGPRLAIFLKDGVEISRYGFVDAPPGWRDVVNSMAVANGWVWEEVPVTDPEAHRAWIEGN